MPVPDSPPDPPPDSRRSTPDAGAPDAADAPEAGSTSVTDAPADEQEPQSARPWQTLDALLEQGASDEAAAFAESLDPADLPRVFSRLDEAARRGLLAALGPEEAAHLVGHMTEEQAAQVLEELEPVDAAAIVDELPSDAQADVLGSVEEEDAAAILEHMGADDAARVRRLLAYDPETAGGLMISEFLAYPESCRVGDVLDDLRARRDEYTDYDVQYAYITTTSGALSGVLRLRDVLLSRVDTPVARIMITSPLRVPASLPLDKLIDLFEDHRFVGVPVVETDGRLVGVVRKTSVFEAAEERASKTFLNLSGIIGGEELRTMPLYARSLRRLAFLAPNIVLNLIAVTVIARYESTLEAVIALAVFLPIVSDMSGCSGNQAVAVSIRELTLGLIRPNEFLRIVWKEGAVGILNGLVLGTALGVVAALWKDSAPLGMVVGSSLALNTVVSVLLGGSVPLFLRTLKVDPALASGPILTTVTDMCGFFLVLSLANAAMEQLVATA